MIKTTLLGTLLAFSFISAFPAHAEDAGAESIKYQNKQVYAPMYKGRKVNIHLITMKDGTVWAMMPYTDLQHVSDVALEKTETNSN